MTAELPVNELSDHPYDVTSRQGFLATVATGPRARALFLWLALGMAAALAAGCGGDGDDSASAATSTGGGGGGGGGGSTSSWSVSGSPPAQTMAGMPFSFTPTVSNPNSVPLTFTYSNLPSWATFNPTSGAITGTPGSGAVATYSNIRLTVSDGTNNYTSPAYTIQVVATASGSATLSWTPPTANTDGSTLTNPSYRVYFGTSQGSYPNVRNVPAGVTSFVVDQLTPGTYYFVMTALDSGGVESVYSNVASKRIN